VPPFFVSRTSQPLFGSLKSSANNAVSPTGPISVPGGDVGLIAGTFKQGGAQVRFDGAELAMVFPRNGSPAELLDGFLAVRSAFALSKSKVLSSLLN